VNAREIIARRVALELRGGDVVNLGIGLPTLVPGYLPPGVTITLQSENGLLGLTALAGPPLPNLVNAGGQPCGVAPGGAFFDSATSFALIRGGHVDVTVLGGLEVDACGNLANWMVPGKLVPGMGGAMDLVTGARRVIVAMEHCTKDGTPKVLAECTLPLTCRGRVHTIVTELALFRVGERGLVLEEYGPGASIDAVRRATRAPFTVSAAVQAMPV
jgi:acetate CoA/acetoacetate CoA-transferase beta subunit